MIAVMTAEGRKAGQSDADHVALLRSMLAYTGGYRLGGDRFIIKVDACCCASDMQASSRMCSDARKKCARR